MKLSNRTASVKQSPLKLYNLKEFPFKTSISAHTYTSRENHQPGEGGALNAGYTPVDALCAISNLLGKHGLIYNVDWWWAGFSYQGLDNPTVVLHFAKEEHKLLLNLGATTEHMLT
jgi:hypothetical protein